jgi:hypothetical protein
MMRCTPSGLLMLALALVFAGCQKEETPARGIEGPLAEFSTAVANVESDYVEANAAIFRSLDVLTPYIDAVLVATRVQNPSCFNPALEGRTYEFDGSAYRAGTAVGAPADGVRFLLYPVTSAGAPLVNQSQGWLEVACASSSSRLQVSARVVSGGTEVLRLDATGSGPVDLEWTGTLRTPDGASAIPWQGSVSGREVSFTARLPQEVIVNYTVLEDSPDAPENVLMQALRGDITPSWELYADIFALASGSITDGPVRFATSTGSHLAACMSGTLEFPTFQNAATGGCSYFGLDPLDLTGSDLNTLQGGYLVLRNLYLVSHRLLGTGVQGIEATF